MKNDINQMAFGTIDTIDTNVINLNDTYAINVTYAKCQKIFNK
jgi:hypothetical protein